MNSFIEWLLSGTQLSVPKPECGPVIDAEQTREPVREWTYRGMQFQEVKNVRK